MPARKILHIIATLDRAGAEKSLATLAMHLPRDEFEVHVCAITRGGPYEVELHQAGVPTRVIGKRHKYDLPGYIELKRHIKRLRPDLVQTWMFTANAYGRRAALAAGVKRIVASEQCADPWKRRLQLGLDRRLAKRTAAIVANAGGVKDFYVGHGIPADKFRVIHGGVQPHLPSPITKEALLAKLGLPPNVQLIGTVGRLWPQKNLRDAIWVSDLLKVARDGIHTLIIGDGPERDALQKYRDQCEIRDRVHFLGHREDVPQLIEHFDLLLTTSAYEGLPNSVLEAMAAGVPVVASDIPGHRELVFEGETGYRTPVGDRGEFARAANRILNDQQLRDRLGQNAQRHVLDNFSVQQFVDQHAELYRELL